VITENAKASARIMNLAYYRKQFAGDKFMQSAVRDLINKGVDELQAHIIVFNTYND
jgi:hypothetical protein